VFHCKKSQNKTQSQCEVVIRGHCEDHILLGCDAAHSAVYEALVTSRNVGDFVTSCLYVRSQVAVLGDCLREIFMKYDILVFHRDLSRTGISFG